MHDRNLAHVGLKVVKGGFRCCAAAYKSMIASMERPKSPAGRFCGWPTTLLFGLNKNRKEYGNRWGAACDGPDSVVLGNEELTPNLGLPEAGPGRFQTVPST